MARRPDQDVADDLPAGIEELVGGGAPLDAGLPEDLDAWLAEAEKADGKGVDLRQPTLVERAKINILGGSSPDKAAKYMRDRGIDPDFDRGFSWHDVTLDAVDDIAKAAGGAVGGIAGAGAGAGLMSVPAMAAGAALGHGAVGTGIKGLAHLIEPELAPTGGRVAKEAATEGALAGLLGVGPRSGVLSKTLARTWPMTWLKSWADQAAGVRGQPGITKVARDTLNKMTDVRTPRGRKMLEEVRGLPRVGTGAGGDMRVFPKLLDPLIEESGAGAGRKVKNLAEIFDKEVRKVPPLDLKGVKLDDFAQGSRSSKQAMLNAMDDVLDDPRDISLALAGKKKLTGPQLRNIYDSLGRHRERIGPGADRLREEIRARMINATPGGTLGSFWKGLTDAKKTDKGLRAFNEGEPFTLFKGLKESKPMPNITPEMRGSVWDALGNETGMVAPLLQRLQKGAGRGTDYGRAARSVRGMNLGLSLTPGSKRLPYATSAAVTAPQVLNQMPMQISNVFNEVASGPGVSPAGGLMDWIARGGKVPLARELKWEGAKAPVKRAAQRYLEPWLDRPGEGE